MARGLRWTGVPELEGPHMNSTVLRQLVCCLRDWVAFCTLAGLPGPLLAQEFPLQAMVLRDDAIAYSGPGEMHYGTAELAQGTLATPGQSGAMALGNITKALEGLAAEATKR